MRISKFFIKEKTYKVLKDPYLIIGTYELLAVYECVDDLENDVKILYPLNDSYYETEGVTAHNFNESHIDFEGEFQIEILNKKGGE